MKIAVVAALLCGNFHAKPYGHGKAGYPNVGRTPSARKKRIKKVISLYLTNVYIY
jgi:hypothetical protein